MLRSTGAARRTHKVSPVRSSPGRVEVKNVGVGTGAASREGPLSRERIRSTINLEACALV